MATGENSPVRSLVLSIPDHQTKPTLAAFVWKQPGVKRCLFSTTVSSASSPAVAPGFRQCPGIPANDLLFQMGKYSFDYVRIFDTCDYLGGATARFTDRNIDIEYPFQD